MSHRLLALDFGRNVLHVEGGLAWGNTLRFNTVAAASGAHPVDCLVF